MPYYSKLWNEEAAMDKWYPEALAAKEKAMSTSIPRNIVYSTGAVAGRGSTGLQRTSFYEQNDTSEATTNNEKMATANKHDIRASINKPLPALPQANQPQTNDAYFEYMFSDAMDDVETIHEDEEVKIAGVEYDSPSSMNSSARSSTQSYYHDFDAPSPPSEDDDLPSTPTGSVADPRYFAFDGTPIKQETPTSSTFAVFNADGSPRFVFAAPLIANATDNIATYTPLTFSSVLPVVNNTNIASNTASPAPVIFAPSLPVANNTNHATNFAVTPLFESDDDESDTEDATAGFYGGFDIEHSPSPYHAPLVDDCAGFGDIRDGCEHFPVQWTAPDTNAELVAPYKLTGLQTFSEEFELPAAETVKPVLKPKSRIAKVAKTCDMGFGYGLHASYTPQLSEPAAFVDKVVSQVNGTKRPAQDSIFNTAFKDLDEVDYEDVDEVDFEEAQSAKKARLLSDDTMDAEAVYAPMPTPTLSACPDLKHKSSARSISSSFLDKNVEFSETVDGYPGQFKALLPPSKILSAKSLRPLDAQTVTFGNKTHANGLFHHHRFQAGGNTSFNEYSLDFSQSVVPSPDGPLGKALRIADRHHEIAASTTRSLEENALRRETHFECAVARLEGVAVGELRYYQGHSGIADYSKGGFCVCWGKCFCTAMCTKYADMVCPCAKHMEFEE